VREFQLGGCAKEGPIYGDGERKRAKPKRNPRVYCVGRIKKTHRPRGLWGREVRIAKRMKLETIDLQEGH